MSDKLTMEQDKDIFGICQDDISVNPVLVIFIHLIAEVPGLAFVTLNIENKYKCSQ